MVGRCIWFSEVICYFQGVHKEYIYIPMTHDPCIRFISGTLMHKTASQGTEPPSRKIVYSTNFCLFADYQAKCIFIDLGAADGNTFAKFIENLGLVLSDWKGVG